MSCFISILQIILLIKKSNKKDHLMNENILLILIFIQIKRPIVIVISPQSEAAQSTSLGWIVMLEPEMFGVSVTLHGTAGGGWWVVGGPTVGNLQSSLVVLSSHSDVPPPGETTETQTETNRHLHPKHELNPSTLIKEIILFQDMKFSIQRSHSQTPNKQ